MTPEDRIYDLIAHAVSLQRRAVETFDALPKAVRDAGDELRSHGMKATGLSIAIESYTSRRKRLNAAQVV